ncbi:MAG: TIGR01777 family oxidoreductase [Muribaculaceae bacterium]
MNIAITGATGFIGTPLCNDLRSRGYNVCEIERKLLSSEAFSSLKSIINNSEVIINLAGATIGQRWSKKAKDEIISSRVSTTRRIVECMNASNTPQLLISASAIGIYDSIGIHDEYSEIKPAQTFLSQVAQLWEAEATKLSPRKRLVIARFGIVLAHDGGALKGMEKSMRYGFGLTIGRGMQPITWIAREDVIKGIEYIISHKEMNGIYNFTAPDVMLDNKFSEKLCLYNNCKFSYRIPEWLVKLLIGEAAEMIITSQYVKSTRLEESGFEFKYPTVDSFLSD